MKRIGLVALAVLAALAGCGKQLASVLRPNQPPEVVVSASPVSTAKGNGSEFQVSWTGFDRDGRIDHFLVAENPVSVDRVDASWKRTAEFGIRLRSRAIGLESETPGASRDPHTVVVRAVDDRGAISDAGSISFFGTNIAPTVQIVSPHPSPLVIPVMPPSFRVSWTGSDPDGQTTTRPVKYKFILLSAASEFMPDVAAANPDSLRRYYAPTFAGWDSTGGDTTSVLYRNLIPNQTYLFAVVAIDEVGDYSPVFSLSTNMLRFRVGFAKLLGPRITLFNESFNYSPPSGGFINDPSRYARLETAPDRTVVINWLGTPQQGADIVGYRWVLDPIDLYDETTRTSPGDVHHWSARDLTTSVTLGPFHPIVKSESHLLFVEALDSFGSRGLGIVKITALKSAPLDRELLIVDDTRMRPDSYIGGCARAPLGDWPTAAELDTFLYARGGVPWRCYPTGTMSTPGLFNGYRYDTLGTRVGKTDLTVPLSTLVKYSHVIWITDINSANMNGVGADQVTPTTALRYMSSPGRFNSLAAYVAGGGHLWLAGAGTALAAHLPWDDRSNNFPPGRIVFSSSIPRELGPGRLMYEHPFWRSALGVQRSPLTIRRFGGRLEGSPQMSGLPAQLDLKSVAPPDPLPPLRANAGQFYLSAVDVAFLFQDNDIVEGAESTLDSLYEGVGSSLPQDPGNPDYRNVLMTQYHGPAHAPVIFTGFNFWDFKRAQCEQLVDYVLQQIWGLTPNAPSMAGERTDSGDSGSATDSPRTTTWQRVRAAVRR